MSALAVTPQNAGAWAIVAAVLSMIVTVSWAAVDRRRYPTDVAKAVRQVRKVGPIQPRSLVLVEMPAANEFYDYFLPDLFDALHREFPAVSFLVTDEDETDLTLIDEDTMRDAGWVRA